MEVEAPEHAINSWRDFFVHMGTVFLGLLLALGLERAAEALRHHRQVLELEEALREDAEKSIRECNSNTALELKWSDWDVRRYQQVASLLGGRGTLPSLPAPAGVSHEVYPADPAWRAAIASGLVAEVSPQETKAFSFLDKIITQMESEYVDVRVATARRLAFEARFPQILGGDDADIALMTPEDRKQYLELLYSEAESRGTILLRLKEISATEDLLNQGERDISRIQQKTEAPDLQSGS